MSLETGTYISDLNASNPVGSTDKVQTADDHIRLLKSTIKASFPGVTGAVTATHTELNVLDGITATTAELNILDGVTLTASNINDAALKSAANTFTATPQKITGSNISWLLEQSGITTGLNLSSGVARVGTYSAHDFRIDTNSVERIKITSTGVITLNGVGVTDFARLSQANTFSGTSGVQTLQTTGTNPAGLQLNTSSTSRATINAIGANDQLITGSLAADLALYVTTGRLIFGAGAGSAPLFVMSSAGNFDFKSGTLTIGGNIITAGTLTIAGSGETLATFADDGAVTLYYDNAAKLATASGGVSVTGALTASTGLVATTGGLTVSAGGAAITGATTVSGALTAATLASSDSETLVAGQLHFIDANATLPNLTAGQWIQIINDSGSAITISKNGSDTTYWSLTGASVSTSFTLAARGKLTAVCNPAGSAVYVSGPGITAAT